MDPVLLFANNLNLKSRPSYAAYKLQIWIESITVMYFYGELKKKNFPIA